MASCIVSITTDISNSQMNEGAAFSSPPASAVPPPPSAWLANPSPCYGDPSKREDNSAEVSNSGRVRKRGKRVGKRGKRRRKKNPSSPNLLTFAELLAMPWQSAATSWHTWKLKLAAENQSSNLDPLWLISSGSVAEGQVAPATEFSKLSIDDNL